MACKGHAAVQGLATTEDGQCSPHVATIGRRPRDCCEAHHSCSGRDGSRRCPHSVSVNSWRRRIPHFLEYTICQHQYRPPPRALKIGRSMTSQLTRRDRACPNRQTVVLTLIRVSAAAP